jgi:Fuc2NAc and GlcNAc transferase
MLLDILPTASLSIGLATVYLVKQKLQTVLIDIPNDRSSHTQPTPRGGGLGFIVAFAITSLVYGYYQQTLPDLLWWWAVLAPLAIIGLCDDRWSIPSTWRYLIQLLTATVAVLHFSPFPQPWLESFGTFGQILAIVFTVIGMTAIVNFYNFMDGLDGLVGGVAAIQVGFLAIYTHQPMLWLLFAGIIGFLFWNWAPAKIFMGDAGSTFLGGFIAIALLNQPANLSHSWSSFVITLPILADAIYTLCRRLIKRENIFQAHRFHIFQRLQQSGLSHSTVAIIYIAVTIAIALLILNYNAVGAIISSVGTVGLIAIGELYIQNTLDLLHKSN